jgi:hypothetical protein
VISRRAPVTAAPSRQEGVAVCRAGVLAGHNRRAYALLMLCRRLTQACAGLAWSEQADEQAGELQLFALDRHQFWCAPGISQRFREILGSDSSHAERHIPLKGCLDGALIDPKHIFCRASATNELHQKFRVLLHSLLCCREVVLRRSCTVRRDNASAESVFRMRESLDLPLLFR